MDMAAIGASLRMLQSSVSTLVLDKAMGADAQSMAMLLSDMEAANPPAQVLAPRPGGMDIRV